MQNFTKSLFTVLLLLLTSTIFAQKELVNNDIISKEKNEKFSGKFKDMYQYEKSFNQKLMRKASEVIDVVDSMKYYDKDIYNKDVYSYNEFGYLTEELTLVWDGTSWVNNKKITNTYTTDGLNDAFLNQSWNGEEWSNITRAFYNYSDDKLEKNGFYEKWDSNQWIAFVNFNERRDIYGNILFESMSDSLMKSEYIYEFKDEKLKVKEESKFYFNDELVDHFTHYYIYDDQDFMIESKYEALRDDGYVIEAKGFYSYNAKGNLALIKEESPDSNDIWSTTYEKEYFYNETDYLDSTISRTWNDEDSLWVLNIRDVYNYDNGGNITYHCKYEWNIENNNWIPSARGTYQYNTAGNLTSANKQEWEDNDWVYSNAFFTVLRGEGNLATIAVWANRIEEVYYSQITDVQENNQLISKYSLEQNYPNPFNPSTVISYQLPENSFVTIKVFDVLGKEIATLVNQQQNAGTYKVNFTAKSFSSGIYFYNIKTNDFTATKKMMLLK